VSVADRRRGQGHGRGHGRGHGGRWRGCEISKGRNWSRARPDMGRERGRYRGRGRSRVGEVSKAGYKLGRCLEQKSKESKSVNP